jgi:predicted RNase H-like HicB family nuclease
MERITLESIPIVVGREDDGRWWADIESMPGVMAYRETRELAIAAVRALALRVAADYMEHGEDTGAAPDPEKWPPNNSSFRRKEGAPWAPAQDGRVHEPSPATRR